MLLSLNLYTFFDLLLFGKSTQNKITWKVKSHNVCEEYFLVRASRENYLCMQRYFTYSYRIKINTGVYWPYLLVIVFCRKLFLGILSYSYNSILKILNTESSTIQILVVYQNLFYFAYLVFNITSFTFDAMYFCKSCH